MLSFKNFLIESFVIEGASRSISRIQKDSEDRNVGVITASRGDLSTEENNKRNKSLEKDIRGHGYGFVHVKGRYVENHGTSEARPVDERSYMVMGKKGDDKGELLGHLKDLGKKYNQDSILHKGFGEKKATLHGTSSGEHAYPGMDKTADVGEFHPNRVPEFHSVLKGKGYSSNQKQKTVNGSKQTAPTRKTFAFEESECGVGDTLVEELTFTVGCGY